MGDEQGERPGPDLKVGVALSGLRDGVPCPGHAGADAVVATPGRDLENLHVEAAMELATEGPAPTGTWELS